MRKKITLLMLLAMTFILSAKSYGQKAQNVAFVHICNIDLQDNRFSDEYLLKISKIVTNSNQPQLAKVLNNFFSNTSGSLKSRVKVLTNTTQSGASVFYKHGDYTDSLFVTINPIKIKALCTVKSFQEQAVGYILIHALSHITLNDFFDPDKTLYAYWNSELDADKNTGRLMIKAYPYTMSSTFFPAVLPEIVLSEPTSKKNIPINARIMSATSGFLESIMPNTFEKVIREGSDITPGRRKAVFDSLAKTDEFRELNEQGMLVGGTGEMSAHIFWLKFHRPADASYTYVARRFNLKGSKTDDDDDDDDDDDPDDLGTMGKKSPFYYNVVGARDDKSVTIKSMAYTFYRGLQFTRDERGIGKIFFYERKLGGLVVNIWENGESFKGKIISIDDDERPLSGVFTKRNGTEITGFFDQNFKYVK